MKYTIDFAELDKDMAKEKAGILAMPFGTSSHKDGYWISAGYHHVIKKDSRGDYADYPSAAKAAADYIDSKKPLYIEGLNKTDTIRVSNALDYGKNFLTKRMMHVEMHCETLSFDDPIRKAAWADFTADKITKGEYMKISKVESGISIGDEGKITPEDWEQYDSGLMTKHQLMEKYTDPVTGKTPWIRHTKKLQAYWNKFFKEQHEKYGPRIRREIEIE